VTVTTDIYAAQVGALLSRRGEHPAMQPAMQPVLFRTHVLDYNKPSLPTLDANNESSLSPTSQSTSITVDRKIRVCRVETLLPDRFTAIFSEPTLVDQRVRFRRDRVAPSDKNLLQEGAIFYWVIATERDASGDLISTSYIRFRRTPRLSPQQLQRLDELAEEAILAGGGTPTSDEDLN
jgi:hypothetical protein